MEKQAVKIIGLGLGAIGAFGLVFLGVLWGQGVGPEEILGTFILGGQFGTGAKVEESAKNFAAENSLDQFTGVDIDENDPQIMDIYGTLKTVDVDGGRIYLDLAAPRYIQKVVEESYRQQANAEPEYMTVNFDDSLKVADPFFSIERPIREMAGAKDGNLEKMKEMFVVVRARLDRDGQPKAERLSAAGISK